MDIASETGQNPTLPQELIDHVLVYMDTTSLKEVSLASHTLLDSSRRHLFYFISTNVRRVGRSMVALEQSIAHSPWMMHSHWIRCLEVSGETPFSTLISVLSALPGLHTFNLKGAKILDVPDPLPSPSIPTRAMKAVSLHSFSSRTTTGNVVSPSEVEFYLLHLFSSVSNVHTSIGHAFRDVESEMAPRWRPTTSRPPKIKVTSFSLRWGVCYNAETIRSHAAMLLQSLDTASVTSLSMSAWPPNYIIGYTPLYLATYHTLSDLTLLITLPMLPTSTQSRHNNPQSWSPFELSSCRALRTVRVVFQTYGMFPAQWHYIIDIFSTVSPFSLSKVTFTLDSRCMPKSTTDGFPWDALESTLIRCCRDAAQVTVVFAVDRGLTPEAEASFQDGVHKKLLQLEKKCVLFFESFEDFDSF